MPKENSMLIQFSSNSVNEGFARVAISSFFSQLDPTVEELYDIKMAVSEAVTNCIVHGYGETNEGKITINCAYDEQEIEIEVIDEGRGIVDIDEAMTALYTTSIDDERAGLGFTVMQSMMDHVDVISQVGIGTTVRMKRSLAD